MPVEELPYDAFINHAKHPLAGAICETLNAMGLKVFLNSEELELGNKEVKAAIKSASLYILIFSKDHAQSSRCLEELSFMSGRKDTKIVPIFWHVKPEDVRYVKGIYAAAFYPNEVGHTLEKLQKWKEALHSVSQYFGPVVENEEDEEMLLKKIPDLVAKEGEKLPLLAEECASANTGSSIAFTSQAEELLSTYGVYNEKVPSGPKGFLDYFRRRVEVMRNVIQHNFIKSPSWYKFGMQRILELLCTHQLQKQSISLQREWNTLVRWLREIVHRYNPLGKPQPLGDLEQLREQLWEQLWQLRKQLRQLCEQLCEQLREQLGEQLCEQLREQLPQLWKQLWQLWKQVPELPPEQQCEWLRDLLGLWCLEQLQEGLWDLPVPQILGRNPLREQLPQLWKPLWQLWKQLPELPPEQQCEWLRDLLGLWYLEQLQEGLWDLRVPQMLGRNPLWDLKLLWEQLPELWEQLQDLEQVWDQLQVLQQLLEQLLRDRQQYLIRYPWNRWYPLEQPWDQICRFCNQVDQWHTLEQLWEQPLKREKQQDWQSTIKYSSHLLKCRAACDRHILRKWKRALREWKRFLNKESQNIVNSKEEENMSQRDRRYDVFINHRGPDVKQTLAKDIYKTLKESGLKPFLDSEEFKWGDHVPSVLEEVMKSAKFHIAIFSENYAQSKWCMEELSFMQSKTCAVILPIFYCCKLKDVRYIKGGFARAFEQHKQKARLALDQLQKWQETLYRASWNLGPILGSIEDKAMLLKNIFDVCKEFVNVKIYEMLKISHHRRNLIHKLLLPLFRI